MAKTNGRNGGNGSSNPKLNGGNNSSNSQLKEIPVTGKTVYTDTELAEFEAIIQKKLDKARSESKILKTLSTQGGDNGTNDTFAPQKDCEEGSYVGSCKSTSYFSCREDKLIKSLENALVRIKNKTYGVCRVTGKLIPKDRLRVVPHATLSIEGKLILAEKNQQKRKPVGFYEKKVKVKMLA